MFSGNCPRNWTRYERTKSCFWVNEQRLKWTEAERQCQKHGGHLATVMDEYENIFLFDLGKKANLTVPTVWLGKIIRLAKNGAYDWHDGSAGRYGAGFRGGQQNNQTTNRPPHHASKRCCVNCQNKCGVNERCIPDDLNCLINPCNGTAPGWCLPIPT
ncbi:hypothetical protein FO519_002708 [Halicephalobus sp. NKZ332]|nr:hypothetical protein FO519_002708 [Halicephalobus sp. NKZ332]